MKMRKLIGLVGALASVAFATPALAIDFGVAVGSGASQSNSTAISGSQGSSASALFGVTAQQSSGGAASAGFSESVMSGNDQGSQSQHTSATTQQGSTFSLGLAGSQNSNNTLGIGSSSASNNLVGVWIFAQP
jgi:hypothetical protein